MDELNIETYTLNRKIHKIKKLYVVFEKIEINKNKKEIKKFLGIFSDEQLPEPSLNEMFISFIKDITEERNFDFVEEIYKLIVLIYFVSKIHKDKSINDKLKNFLHKLYYFFIDINKITYMDLDKKAATNKTRDFFVCGIKDNTSKWCDNETKCENNDEENNNDGNRGKKQLKRRGIFIN